MIHLPSREAHLYWDRQHFGRTYPKIHRELDKSFKTLGARHRLKNHNPYDAIGIAQKCYPNDPVAVQSALYHLFLDEQCSADPDFRDTLEALAKLDKKRRRRKRR